MIRVNTNSFVFGRDTFPDWFREKDKQGKVKYKYQLNLMSGAVLQTQVGVQEVFIGDTIMLINDELVVVKKEAANKYMEGGRNV